MEGKHKIPDVNDSYIKFGVDHLFKIADICAFKAYDCSINVTVFGKWFYDIRYTKKSMPKKFSDLFYQLNDTVYVKKDKFFILYI